MHIRYLMVFTIVAFTVGCTNGGGSNTQLSDTPIAAASLPNPPFDSDDSESNFNAGAYSFDQGSWRYNLDYIRSGESSGVNPWELMKYKASFIPEQEGLEVDSTLTTDHDNDVYFDWNQNSSFSEKVVTITSFTLNSGEDGVCVTPGQPYRWTQARGDHITARAGRHGEGYCAQRWNERVGGGKNTFNHEADELNFYVGGTLTLTFTSPSSPDTSIIKFSDIYLAQGHSGATNNWWFGGKNCSRDKRQDNQVICPGVNYGGYAQNGIFLRGSGTDVDQVVAGPE